MERVRLNTYYLYELIDPRDGSVFYVGKGKDDRYLHHEREADAGILSYKCNKIRAIKRAGFKIEHRIVKYFFDEEEAYQAERAHIKRLGRRNLTNVTFGGKQYVPTRAEIHAIVFEQRKNTIAKIDQWKERGLRLTIVGVDMTDKISDLLNQIKADASEILGV